MDDVNKRYWTDDDELVEKYVLGKISAEEKKKLDLEIADCEPCKEKLRHEMEIAAGIRRYGRDRMKARLRTKLKRERAAQFYSYQYIGLAAAVVIIAIGVGLYQIWFSDLVAPKQFHQQQIVLTPQVDTGATKVKPLQKDERLPEPQQKREQKETASEGRDIAGKEISNQPSLASKSSSGVASGQQQVQPPAASLAEVDGMAEETKVSNTSSAIWLIGKVVIITERSTMRRNTASKIEMSKKTDGQMAKEKAAEYGASEKTVALRLAKDEGIVLQQRAVKDLPAGRMQQRLSQKQEIETLLERTESGISLTLFDDSVKESDLQKAVVETFSDDSLVVSLPNQRIAFSLPSGWNTQSIRR